jgi:Cdc6-like AAA superfamily ATPase
MSEIDPILIGKGEDLQYLLPAYSNRHGLVTGATGTGKTVTLQVLARSVKISKSPGFIAVREKSDNIPPKDLEN